MAAIIKTNFEEEIIKQWIPDTICDVNYGFNRMKVRNIIRQKSVD